MVLIVVTAIILVIFLSRNAREGAIKPAVTPQGPDGKVPTMQPQGTPTAIPKAKPELPMITPEFNLLESKIVREAMMNLSPNKMKEHLRFLSSKPHLSGTPRSEVDVVNYILREFGENLDQAFKVPYTILHQYPDPNNPNKVQVIDAKGDVVLDAGMHEAAIPNIDTDSVPGYLAYSPTGTVEGDIIFVNYGTYPDFDKLEKNNISVKGFICLARYGGGHRGEKVRNCHERGGIATIIFSDPKAVSPLGLDNVYPNSEFVGGTALQRGALYTYGDPETPGYPSIKEALRYPNTSDMPQIPGLVIGYDDARLLFGYMGSDVVETTPEFTAKWNMTYRRGPLKPEHAGMKVRLTVNNEWKRVEVFNVIGVLKGSHEPDRYSMLGNHHDAWGRGTIDPSSATAPMMEQAYVLGQLVKKGIWRPRRSIIFGVWAAEEIAIAGSGEWVEDKFLLLNHGAVGYVNVDNCPSGPSFVPYASPSLKNTFYTAAQLVPHGNQTLLEFWREFENVAAPALPNVRLTHGGADNNAFNFYAGIPAVALTFRPDPKKYSATYASYHTAYETFHLYETFIDKDFSGMKRCAQTQLVLTLYLSEAELLPYNMMDLGDALSTAYGKLEPKFTPHTDHTVDIGWLKKEISLFKTAASEWHKWLSNQKTFDMGTLRMVNDRMMLVERAFIKPEGLMGRPTIRHLAFAPQLANAYAGAGFPTVHDQLYYLARMKPNTPEVKQAWDDIRRNVNDAALAIRAARLLIDPNMII